MKVKDLEVWLTLRITRPWSTEDSAVRRLLGSTVTSGRCPAAEAEQWTGRSLIAAVSHSWTSVSHRPQPSTRRTPNCQLLVKLSNRRRLLRVTCCVVLSPAGRVWYRPHRSPTRLRPRPHRAMAQRSDGASLSAVTCVRLTQRTRSRRRQRCRWGCWNTRDLRRTTGRSLPRRSSQPTAHSHCLGACSRRPERGSAQGKRRSCDTLSWSRSGVARTRSAIWNRGCRTSWVRPRSTACEDSSWMRSLIAVQLNTPATNQRPTLTLIWLLLWVWCVSRTYLQRVVDGWQTLCHCQSLCYGSLYVICSSDGLFHCSFYTNNFFYTRHLSLGNFKPFQALYGRCLHAV